MKLFLPTLLTALVLLLNSCIPYEAGNNQAGNYLDGFNQAAIGQNGQVTPQGYWDDAGVTGPSKIKINLAEQRAYYYKGATLVGVSPISSGTSGHRTPRGRFKVSEKDIDHTSSLYGVIKDTATGATINSDADSRIHRAGPGEVFVHAPMNYFLRFNGSIGMHAGYLPGYAASHGCVRLPSRMAKIFYENSPHGTPVIVE